MKKILIFAVLIIAGCATNDTAQQKSISKQQQVEPPYSKKVYFFQHKILPQWTFNSNGNFYTDLINGNLDGLKSAATEIVSKEFAEQIETEVFSKDNAVLITFPKPQAFANCFFVLIKKNDNNYSFLTYEKTIQLGEDDQIKGVVGAWNDEGSHLNLGGRTYKKSSDFAADMLKKATK